MTNDRTYLRLPVRDMQALEPKGQSTDGAAPVRDMRDRTILALPVTNIGMPTVSDCFGGSGGGAAEVAGGDE